MRYCILDPVVTESEIHELYEWIDSIPLSRPKKNINRDFSDAVLMAEVVRHFYPKFVEIHNYIGTSNYQQKVHNWNLLNKKVLSKILGGALNNRDIEECASGVPGAVERVLNFVKPRLPSVPNQQMMPPSVTTREEKSPREAAAVKKEPSVDELVTTVTALQERVAKLEQLVQIKDLKIKTLQDKLQELGVNIRKP